MVVTQAIIKDDLSIVRLEICSSLFAQKDPPQLLVDLWACQYFVIPAGC
jgi:hypothetical protein